MTTDTDSLERCGRLAFKKKEAAALLGVSPETVRRLLRARKLYQTKTLRLITKEELLRYLREETDATKRTKRFPSLHRKQNTLAESTTRANDGTALAV